jgi:hypothetical protein
MFTEDNIMRLIIGLATALCFLPFAVLAESSSAARPNIENIDLTIVTTAVKDCQPECVTKQFDDFKNGLDDYFDQTKGCEEKFNVFLKQKKHNMKQWYSRECIIQCMNVVKQEFSDYEDVKGQIGSGAFAFWASKGAITAAEQICAKGG